MCMVQIKLSGEVEDIAKRMASLTPGFSGADIASVCNEVRLTVSG